MVQFFHFTFLLILPCVISFSHMIFYTVYKLMMPKHVSPAWTSLYCLYPVTQLTAPVSVKYISVQKSKTGLLLFFSQTSFFCRVLPFQLMKLAFSSLLWLAILDFFFSVIPHLWHCRKHYHFCLLILTRIHHSFCCDLIQFQAVICLWQIITIDLYFFYTSTPVCGS